MAAYVGKKEVPLEAALVRAYELLGACKNPVIAGQGADVAGMRAALKVAAQLGGAFDFCRGPGATNLIRAMIDKGLMFTTPREARARADVLLMVGPSVGRSEAITDILEGQPVLSAGNGAKRDVLWLCPANAAEELSRFDMLVADAELASIHGIIGLLNAALRSRPTEVDGFGGLFRQDYEEIAGRLITARFGVIAFAPEDLDSLAIEALFGFAENLNASTRVTMLPIITNGPAQTAAMVCGWTTGFPPRLGFARGYPEFDMWRFDAARMNRSGEVDGLLWLSPFEAKGPDWRCELPTVAITRPGAALTRAPEVLIETEIPAADTRAELFNERLQALIAAPAIPMGGYPTPGAILERLLGHMEAQGA
jgi:formylmethanofuran dehydrogenase subunit B